MSQTLAKSIFRPDGKLKGCVTIVHGMAEHRARYDAFAIYLKDRGYGVVTYDLPGHGESCDANDFGWFGDNGWDRLVDSAVEMIRITRQEFPNVPLILFAHSMGTIIARCLLQKYDVLVDGVILSGAPNYQAAAGAGIALGKTLSLVKGKRGHSKLMDQMVTGNFNKSIENPRTDVDWLSYNEKNVDAYIEHPWCGFGFTIQGYIDELTGIQNMHDVKRYHVTKPDLPIWFFAGSEDPCTGGAKGLEDSMKTLKEAGYHNISCRQWLNMRHETLQEEKALDVFLAVREWLDEHCENA